MVEIYLSDLHAPYHDKAAWSLARKVISEIKPEMIFLGGDMIDCLSVSSYSKNPIHEGELQMELESTRKCLRQLRDLRPNAKMMFLEGNHEDRLRRYINQHAKAFASVSAISIDQLLTLEEFNIEYIPYKQPTQIGELWHIHGDEVAGGSMNVARNIYLRLQASVIFGHYHCFGSYFGTPFGKPTQGAFANGFLGGMDPSFVMNPQWQQGVTLIDYSPSGFFHVEPIVFFRQAGRLVTTVRGKEYSRRLDQEV